MEALLAFGVNWKLLFIQGVNFGLLLLILSWFLYKPLFTLLNNRQRVIEQGLKDAEEAALEKEKVEKEKSTILAKAREEGGKLMDGLRKEAIVQEKNIIREAHGKSTLLLAEAEAKAKAEREHILREGEKDMARMAILAAEKILRSSH